MSELSPGSYQDNDNLQPQKVGGSTFYPYDDLEGPQEQVVAPTEFKPRSPKRLILTHKTTLLGMLLLVAVLIVGAITATLLSHNDKKSNRSVDEYVITNGGLDKLNADTVKSLEGAGSLKVNGSLEINNSFVLNPTDVPSSPTAGQIYFSKQSGLLYFYNGQKFVELGNSPGAALQGAAGINGTNGKDGINGTNGKDGLSVTGNFAFLDVNSQTFTGSTQLFQNTIDGASAFQINNSLGSNILSVNTSTSRVGIGTTVPGAKLTVVSGATAPLFRITDNSGSSIDVVNIADEGYATFRNATNSTTAFQIQNAAGSSNLFIADTVNGRIGIGKASPSYALDVNGDVNLSSGFTYRINGVAVCDVSGCSASGGSGNYIQNSSLVQVGANFNIQSASASSPTAILTGASGQTVDIFQIWTYGAGTPSFTISATGYTEVRRGGGVKDALRLVSTSLGTGITIANDTNIYRGAVGTLYTDNPLYINNNSLLTSASTFNLLNATPTTINAFGNASVINIGAAGSSIIGGGALTVRAGGANTLNVGTNTEDHTTSIGTTTGTSSLNLAAGSGGINAYDHVNVGGNSDSASTPVNYLKVASNSSSYTSGYLQSYYDNMVLLKNAYLVNNGGTGFRYEKTAVAAGIQLDSVGGFNVMTVGSGSAGGLLTPVYTLGIDNTGKATFKNRTDSTTAFQIQRASDSVTIFGIDTTNSRLFSNIADGASAVGFTLNTTNSYTTAGAKLLSVQNNTAERFSIDKDGHVVTYGHIKSTQTTAPTIGTPSSCGSSPTASVVAGSTDAAGSFTITAGTGSPGNCAAVITFNTAYGAPPKSVILTPASATGSAKDIYVSGAATTTFTATMNTSPAASEANTYYYWVIE